MKDNYFDTAHSWATSRIEMLEVISNRWQCAFWLLAICLLASTLAIFCMMPFKTIEPIIIQKDLNTGEVFVSLGDAKNLTKTQQETESDLVRYVTSRETYSAVDEEVRYRQVQYTSSRDTFAPYIDERRASNPNSFEALLGDKGIRTVKVEDVVFLDASDPTAVLKKNNHALPIAKVDFITTQTQGQSTKKQYWVATIKFAYFGTPNTKEAAWADWDGFTVTSYRVDERNHAF